MNYRICKKTGDKISEIGIGSSYIYQAGKEEAVKILRQAYEGGINYFDLATGDGSSFPIFGEAFSDVREEVFYQIHFGADYTEGTYGWSLDLETVKKSIAWQLEQLHTDYIDYGFIHCQDEISDWETYKENGIWDYICSLKEKGMVRHIGLSSHTPSVINKILDEVDVDLLMFSINPAYDYGQGEFAVGSVDERTKLYQRCEKEGIGISVMKPFSAGQLLDASISFFQQALSPYQCIQYALDKPGVVTVLAGAQSMEEVEELLDFYHQPEEAKDYSVIGTFTPIQAEGKCVYCNHCKPCPVGLDIGLINKYYDLAKAGDSLAMEHYRTLEKTAADCIGCGHCDKRCPFRVEQSKKMQVIKQFFEEVQTNEA